MRWDDLNKRRRARWTPPAKPRRLSEFARTILLPDGAAAGTKWIPESEPTQRLAMAEIESGKRSRIVFAWPSQRGKTLLGILLLWLHTIAERRQSVSYLMPSLDKLSQNWEGKIKPAIVGSGYGGWLPQKGPGSKGGRPAALTMRDPRNGLIAGRTYFMALGGGGKETSVSSVTTATALVDEGDDAESAGQLELAFKRTSSYGAAGRTIVVSTVNNRTDRKSHPILDLADTGTKSRIHHCCPHCGDFAPITRERIVDRACVCQKCAAVWTKEDAAKALNNAKLVHAVTDTKVFSLICVGPDFHMGGGLEEIIAQGEAAQKAIDERGDHSLMVTYRNKVWCEHYDSTPKDEDGQTIIPTRNRLAALSHSSEIILSVDRREEDGDSVHLAELPTWIEHQAVAVDVQQGGDRAPGRLYFLLIGRGKGRGAITGYGSIVSAPKGRHPSTEELHSSLDKLDGLLADWAPGPPIVRRGIDVGDRMDELVKWIRIHPKWWALKGGANLRQANVGDHPGWIARREQDAGWMLHLVETSCATSAVHGELLGKSLLLPRGLERESALIRHLCGTVEYRPGKWSTKAQDRVHHPEWQNRHDYLDAAAYCRALIYDWEHRAKLPPRKYGFIGSIN